MNAPKPKRVVVFKLGGLVLTGAPAVAAILGSLALIAVLVYRFEPAPPAILSALLWIAFIAYWSATAKKASAAKSSESRESRRIHENLLVTSFVLLFIPIPGLTARFLPQSNVFVVAGLVGQASFLLLAVWARRHLGRNWSGAVSVTVDHQLVLSGPYSRVRHPIYTAMLGMFAGTALRSGELHALIGVAILTAAYVRKIRIEEETLRTVFGSDYDAYARTTWGLLPRAGTMIVLGAIVVGTLDILYAIAFWYPRGVVPARIFQSIAAGLYGRASFTGGTRTVVIGAALHYFIALCIVLVYWLASRRLERLVRRPILWGSFYGILVYVVMNYVVIPLSATKRPAFLLSWVVCSVLVHAFLIGVPAALISRAARSTRAPPKNKLQLNKTSA
jgi:protein-S-isoprenylcysteine O-methyltransferase Ste14